MTNLELATKVANLSFFGYKVMMGDINANCVSSSHNIRNAIKYQSLDRASQDIWDDPNMLQAHKYQNIPQVDISYYMDDYIVDGNQRYPIELGPDSVTVTYVFSATNAFHEVTFAYSDPLYDKLIKMSHIDRIEKYINDHGIVDITYELCLLIFGADDLTDMVSDGNPSYGITIKDLYAKFQEEPNNLYVPYRRGWSRILNVQPFDLPSDISEFAVVYDTNEIAHIVGLSAITVWDGFSTRIENHGVEVEDMKVNMIYDTDSMTFKMRCLEGTHEHMHDVILVPPSDPPKEYFAVYAIKGVNINGFEFNMP